jgi:hypothetical protein
MLQNGEGRCSRTKKFGDCMGQGKGIDGMQNICFSSRPGSKPCISFAAGNHHHWWAVKDFILKLSRNSKATFRYRFPIEDKEIDW